MNIMKFYVRTEESPIKTLCDDSYYKALRIYLYEKGYINCLNSPVDQYSEEFTTPKDRLCARFYIKMQIENKDFTFDCEVRDGMSDHGSGDLCISNSENFNDSYSIELTKNSDGESGNMDEQRLPKAVDAFLFNENPLDSEVNSKKNPNRHDKTRRVFSTLGIKIYNSKISKENITELTYSPYDSLEEASEWLKKENSGIFYDCNKNHITSTVRLHKGKNKESNDISDPSVGFVVGSLRLIRHFEKNVKLSIDFRNHGFAEPSKYFNGDSKLFKWIQKLEMNFTYDTKLPMFKSKGTQNAKTKTPGEKQAGIPFNFRCKQKDLETIFSNHASSAQTYFVDPQDKFLSIPKKIDKPDIIMRDKKHKVLYAIEAEKFQNMNKGIKQIQGWKNQKSVKGKTIPSLYNFLEAQYPGFEIKTGIVLSGVPKNKVDIAKHSSWGYTTNEGELCITKEFHEILGE